MPVFPSWLEKGIYYNDNIGKIMILNYDTKLSSVKFSNDQYSLFINMKFFIFYLKWYYSGLLKLQNYWLHILTKGMLDTAYWRN